jgi:hypothetical protein
MGRVLAQLKQDWRHFRDDHAGKRFCNHRKRMERKSRGFTIVSLAIGITLVAGGLVLCVLPGPGIPLIIFGLALIASHSDRLAAALDRAEPPIRRAGRKTKHHWRALPGKAKLSFLLGFTALAAAAALFVWHFVVRPYLLA